MTDLVRFDREGSAVHLVLDRPPLNVLNHAMLEQLADALAVVRAMDEARVLVITGAGRAFCAGVDVADHTADRVQRTLPLFDAIVHSILTLEVPVIGAINGAALGGGCELMLACDVVLASDRASIGQPEIQLGVFPPVAAALLPSLVGVHHAMDLVLTGRSIGAGEARELGLVTHVYPADHFADDVAAYVATLTALSGPVLRMAKRAVRAGIGHEPHGAIDRAEALYLNELMRLRDAHEGITAFMERRRPMWWES